MSDTETRRPREPLPEPQRFTLLVEGRDLPDDAPLIVRLRRWLKAGLRAYGLRCKEIVPTQPEKESNR